MNAVAAVPPAPAPATSGTASTAPAGDRTPFADVLQAAVSGSSTSTGGRSDGAQTDTTADADSAAAVELTPTPTTEVPAEADLAVSTEADDLAALTAAVAAMLTGAQDARASDDAAPLGPTQAVAGDLPADLVDVTKTSDVDIAAPTDAPMEGGQPAARQVDPALKANDQQAAPTTPVPGDQVSASNAQAPVPAIVKPATGNATTADVDTPGIASDADPAVATAEGEPAAPGPVDGATTTAPTTPAGRADAAAATQPVAATTRVDAAAAPESVRESAPAPSPAAPSTQVATAVAALQRRGEGTYTASIDLHPSELGQVRVEVEIRNGVVNVLMSPEQGSTRALLVQQMHQLRDALQQAGLDTGSLDVASQSPQDGEASEDRRDADGPRGVEVADDEVIHRAVALSRDHHTDTSVDLRV